MFDVPLASAIVASSTEYSTTWFTEFLPFLYVVVGIAAAVALLMFLRKKIGGAVARMGGGRRGRRRR